jgi:hypothetical protein
LDWTFPYYALEPHPVSVHAMVGARNWMAAAWSMASLFHLSRQNWNLLIHDDGTLPADAADWFCDGFPTCRIIGRREADSEMESHLRNYPRCRSLRISEPLFRPFLDAARYAAGRKFLLLRMPALFFKQPEDLMACASDPEDCCWFVRGSDDLPEPVLDVLNERFNVHPWPRLDTSVALVAQSALSLDLIESALDIPLVATAEPNALASALAGICAARAGRGGLLGPEYVTRDRSTPEDRVVCRHYEGGAEDRQFADGCERLLAQLFPEPGE